MTFAYQRHDVPRVHLEEAAASGRALRVPHQLDADSLSAAGLRVLGNHDRSRVGTRLDQAHVATMLLPTLRGRSCMQEIIAPEHVQDPWEKCVPGLVSPTPWSGDSYGGYSIGTNRGCRWKRKEPSTFRSSGTTPPRRCLFMKHCCDSAVPSPPGAVARSRGPAPTELGPNDGFICDLETGESGSPRQSR